MNVSPWILILFALAASPTARAADQTITYYVQVVRGTDSDEPPIAGAKLIGPRLKARLSPVFRWKSYWEIKRVQLVVENGKTGHVALPEGMAIDICRAGQDQREVCLYRGTKLTRKLSQAENDSMTIIGGAGDSGNGWFAVVRRDRPKVVAVTSPDD